MDPKQQLADLMDAFAAAKVSQNETLQRLVLVQVNQFFAAHEIVPVGTTMSAPPDTEDLEEDGTGWGS